MHKLVDRFKLSAQSSRSQKLKKSEVGVHSDNTVPNINDLATKAPRPANNRTRNFAMGALAGAIMAGILVPLIEPFALSSANHQQRKYSEQMSLSRSGLSELIDTELLRQASLSSYLPVNENILEETIRIKKGSTLMNAMLSAGVRRNDAHNAILALEEVADLRQIPAGQTAHIETRAEDNLLYSIVLPLSAEREIAAYRIDSKFFNSYENIKNLELAILESRGTIQSSLLVATQAQNVPTSIAMNMVRLFSWDVDFQRDIHPGDSFELLFETFLDDAGRKVKDGEILRAVLNVQGTKLQLYRYKQENGQAGYFNENGESVRKALLKTPVDGARLSSRFGNRRHPVLGYTRMHRGIDFAAPKGTPIVAAGDGVIEFAGRNGGYGRYVRIRHNSNYKTAYAHLWRFSKNARRNKRVKQGQTIGFVGTSGVSTGPHLHYEIHHNGKQINPLALKLPTGKKLRGKALAHFKLRRDEIQVLTAQTTSQIQSAQSK